MTVRRLAIAAAALLASMSSASAKTLSWETGRSDADIVLRAYTPTAQDDAALEGDDETALYFACGEGGKRLWFWVHIDEELLPGQTRKPDGMRRELPVPATIALGQASFENLKGRVVPEELYGGNELQIDIPQIPAFLAALSKARTMDIRAASYSSTFSLAGAAAAITKFQRDCRGKG